MKYIKLYEKDIEWDFVDEEEEYSIKVGDTVQVKKDLVQYWYKNKWVILNSHHFRRQVIDIKHSSEISYNNNKITDYDGYMMYVSNTTSSLWFKMEDFFVCVPGLSDN